MIMIMIMMIMVMAYLFNNCCFLLILNTFSYLCDLDFSFLIEFSYVIFHRYLNEYFIRRETETDKLTETERSLICSKTET